MIVAVFSNMKIEDKNSDKWNNGAFVSRFFYLLNSTSFIKIFKIDY